MGRSAIVDIIGRACRLPGARGCDALWDVLVSERCTVGQIGEDRWSKARFYNPRQGERGKSYTFAAGVLEDVWGFDPGVFGLTPREAEHMDPQQRLLLQVVWEALEDAGIRPSALAGSQVGVFVGVSSPDTATRRSHDVGATDAYTMTGSTLSLVANRISYVFDWHGPSLSIDTACSSSLVALSQALDALQAGSIDTAVVGGVNVLLSPFPFLGFAAARMLAADGRCRPFDADGNGYVRAEGAVALVLRRREAAAIGAARRYAEVVAAAVNSDGRTSGVSLPSAASQAALLQALYLRAGVDRDDLAFVEAHGTGTRVGDPAEAEAIGRVLGQKRSQPLPIGSIKSNIGHLEPAAGLAGVLKAMLAFEHGVLPASLHFKTPNPAIPFEALNIAVAGRPVALQDARRPLLAGVSAFGFGGTNAHVILRQGRAATAPRQAASANAPAVPLPAAANPAAQSGSGLLFLSAHCRDALAAQALACRRLFEAAADGGEAGPQPIAAAIAVEREHLPERLVVAAASARQAVTGLDAFLAGEQSPAVTAGRAVAEDATVAFVYAGNGSQWAGMGRLAYAENAVFRARFDALSRRFTDIAGWSLIEALLVEDPGDALASASVAQPLLFAIQAALTDALAAQGLEPSAVIGHSVGEIAAAYACGALSEAQALRVIAARSSSQELARGAGTMAALGLPQAEARQLIADCACRQVEVGAINSPHSVTLSGPRSEIEHCARIAATRGAKVKVLDLEYPFHCALVEVARRPLLDALEGMVPSVSRIPFISTVTGDVRAGESLEAGYWWHNVRAPVRFAEAIARAADLGARVFVEISPRAILQGYLAECLGNGLRPAALIASLGPGDAPGLDPVRMTTARALARGAKVDIDRAFGTARADLRLPLYPWQNKVYDVAPSQEATGTMLAGGDTHPYLGWRERAGIAEWFSHLDIDLLPELGEHRIGGQVYVPGAVLAEMAVAAAAQWLGTTRAEVYDFDILAPLVLGSDHMREVRTSIEAGSRSLRIASRRRLTDEAWQVHVEARFAAAATPPLAASATAEAGAAIAGFDASVFYHEARGLGLDYGPRFRRLSSVAAVADGGIAVGIAPAPEQIAGRLMLDPIALDVAFHGLLFRLLDTGRGASRQGWVPIRFGRILVHRPGLPIREARIRQSRRGATTTSCDVVLLDGQGVPVAEIQEARFKASTLLHDRPVGEIAYRMQTESLPLPGYAARRGVLRRVTGFGGESGECGPARDQDEEARLLLEAAARRVALDAVAPRALTAQGQPAAQGRLVVQGGLAGDMRAPLLGLLGALESAGLVTGAGSHWQITDATHALPPLDAIIQTVMAEHPEWWPDCALLAAAAAAWRRLLADPRGEPAGLAYSPAVLEAFAIATPRGRSHVRHIMDAVEHLLAETAGGAHAATPLRVLEIGPGEGALTRPLARLLAAHGGRLLSVDDEPRAVERLAAHFAGHASASFVESAGFEAVAGRHGPFDLIVSANGLHRLSGLDGVLAIAARHAAGRPQLLAACAVPDTFHDVVFGLQASWFRPGVAGAMPVSPLLSAAGWHRRLAAARCTDVRAIDTGVRGEVLLSGVLTSDAAAVTQTAVGAEAPPSKVAIVTAGTADQLLAIALETRLWSAGHDISVIARDPGRQRRKDNALVAGDWRQVLAPVIDSGGRVADIVFLSGTHGDEADPTEALWHRLCDLTATLQGLGEQPFRLWLVAPGALRDRVGGPGCPVQAGIAAYARTATNEFPAGDIRLVDLDSGLDADAAAERLARLVREPGIETEMLLRADSLTVVRVVRGLPQTATGAPDGVTADTARLELSSDPGRQRLAWRRTGRRAPGPGEVEIEVVATGLNFRDCMWSMGLLPEEALEDGFAGPTLGFECAGRIVRVGERVDGFAPGDAVIAFAPAAFASHVTVAAEAVASLPAGICLDAAATIPVAFITAYYALDHLARLAPGDSLLIHGGAGGVGLAALQIARRRRARVFATAGSAEKRELLCLLGADHVLDSRSLAFVDDVLALTGGSGVDVVLNSLAGEAMERSLGLVRPFGRFLELGKRDFYGATKIGLRPFRRNVSYFGIDADQLLAQKPKLVRQLLAELTGHLEAGTFVPLPYRRFEASEVADAFRLMMQSGHIGKVVVTPPKPDSVPAEVAKAPFAADPAGVHVVIGGLGGFGLATARWLLTHGARRLVLISRSGRPADGGQAALAALQELGAGIEIEAVDATDGAALAALLARIRGTAPIRGIVHAAMVLDDGLITGLTPERIERVLAPKVAVAAHLDRLTRQDELQYFVLYSSVTALIGNPGQAAYVAANGYLEGLARQRRAAGLPALAVGWGGITDTGYLARNVEIGRAIERGTGASAFTAAEALGALGELLALGPAAPPAVTVAPMSWGAAGDRLRLLGKPLFAPLLAAGRTGSAVRSEPVDIATEIAGLDEAGARDLVCRHLSEEVARIFRMPVADVSASRSLAELGMDSLMGLELRLAVQQRLGTDIPLAAMAGNQTLSETASRIARTLRSGQVGDQPVAGLDADLAHQHVANGIDADKLAPLLREIERREARMGA